MSSLLQLGSSSLLAYENCLQNTGHNISNAETPGYTRQRVNLSSATLVGEQNNSFGTGVTNGKLERLVDDYTTRQLWETTSLSSLYDEFYQHIGSVDQLLADEQMGITPRIQDFFSALNSAITDPSSLPERQVLLASARNLVSSLQQMNSAFEGLDSDINTEISNTVATVNTLAQGIGLLNEQIVATNGQAPDFLDQRDELIRQLSEIIDTTTINQADGSTIVLVGTGQLLVSEENVLTMSAPTRLENPAELDVQITSYSALRITDKITTGKLGALLNFQDDVLHPAQNALGRLAAALTEMINQQHEEGMDLLGNIGQSFFSQLNSPAAMQNRVINNALNTGDGVISVSITDVNALTTSDYQLFVLDAGNNYQLIRKEDNKLVQTGTLSSLPFSINIDGMSITLESGVFQSNDSFLIQPTNNYINTFNLALNDPNEIALALPVRIMSDSQNIGTGIAEITGISDLTNPSFSTANGALSPPIRIEFLSSTSYRIVNDQTGANIDPGPITFVPNQSNVIFPTAANFDPGYRVNISGSPQAGDIFTLTFNSNAQGDNRNGLLIANIQSQQTLANGTANLQQLYGLLVTEIGSQTQQAEIQDQSTSALLQSISDRRESISGVNLDEEAANLLKFQQAYQASAQLVNTANLIFGALLQALGG